jgi:hypothetical protein
VGGSPHSIYKTIGRRRGLPLVPPLLYKVLPVTACRFMVRACPYLLNFVAELAVTHLTWLMVFLNL